MFKKFKEEAITFYRNGEYQKAAQGFQKADDVQEQYDLFSFDDNYEIAGYLVNTYFKLGEYSMCKTKGLDMLRMKPGKSQVIIVNCLIALLIKVPSCFYENIKT